MDGFDSPVPSDFLVEDVDEEKPIKEEDEEDEENEENEEEEEEEEEVVGEVEFEENHEEEEEMEEAEEGDAESFTDTDSSLSFRKRMMYDRRVKPFVLRRLRIIFRRLH